MLPVLTMLTNTFASLSNGAAFANFVRGHVKAGKDGKLEENAPSAD